MKMDRTRVIKALSQDLNIKEKKVIRFLNLIEDLKYESLDNISLKYLSKLKNRFVTEGFGDINIIWDNNKFRFEIFIESKVYMYINYIKTIKSITKKFNKEITSNFEKIPSNHNYVETENTLDPFKSKE